MGGGSISETIKRMKDSSLKLFLRTNKRNTGKRERSLLDLADTLESLEKEIERSLDNECSEACKKPAGKNRSMMIQRRIESIFAIETDIVSFCLLNQPLIDLERCSFQIYITFPSYESYNECF